MGTVTSGLADFDPKEARGSDAEDGERKVIQVDGLSQNGRAERKAAPPVGVADYGHWIPAWDFVLLSCERSTRDGLDA